MEYIISFYLFFYNDRIVSVRKTSYLNLESEAYLRRREIYTWHRIYIYIYKKRNVHVT